MEGRAIFASALYCSDGVGWNLARLKFVHFTLPLSGIMRRNQEEQICMIKHNLSSVELDSFLLTFKNQSAMIQSSKNQGEYIILPFSYCKRKIKTFF